MSRSTQYIGLTQDAKNWVRSAIEVKQFEMTLGMFDEPVMGAEYIMPAPRGPNKCLIAREKVQDCQWSSGPMIFTHLELILVKESGQEIQEGYAFSWVLNPELRGEYDPVKGHYWV